MSLVLCFLMKDVAISLCMQYVGFALLFLSFFMCAYFAYNEELGQRKVHYVSLTICGIASLAYLYASLATP